jgi:hypothetical protein
VSGAAAHTPRQFVGANVVRERVSVKRGGAPKTRVAHVLMKYGIL